MSPFFPEIPKHATGRLKIRKISRDLVRRCIARGVLIEVREDGRQVRQLEVSNRLLEVIYRQRTGGFILVSCYWKGEYP
jgi:hypothetical protein